MVIYTREQKTLIIPEGFGSSMNCEEQYREGYNNGYQSGYTEGYAEGQEDCPDCRNKVIFKVEKNEMIWAHRTGLTMSINGVPVEDITVNDFYGGDPSYIIVNGYTTENVASGVQLTIDATQGTFPLEWDNIYINETEITGFTQSCVVTDIDTYKHTYTYTFTFSEIPITGATCILENGFILLSREWDGDDNFNPSQGYDGFNSVRICDNGYGDSKFNQGYQSGYTEGYNSGLSGATKIYGRWRLTFSEDTIIPATDANHTYYYYGVDYDNYRFTVTETAGGEGTALGHTLKEAIENEYVLLRGVWIMDVLLYENGRPTCFVNPQNGQIYLNEYTNYEFPNCTAEFTHFYNQRLGRQ